MIFFNHQRISQGAVRTSHKDQLDSRWGSVLVFLRESIATCDFLGGGGGGGVTHCPSPHYSGSTHV